MGREKQEGQPGREGATREIKEVPLEGKAIEAKTEAPETAQPERVADAALVARLVTRVEQMLAGMEKANIAEYVALLRNPRRLLYINFLAGMARGFGIAIGATAVAAVFLYTLGKLAALNLPLIGKFIADITWLVQNNLRIR